MEVGTKLVFSIVPGTLDENKIFDGFRINEDKKRVERDEVYVVDASHAVNEGGKKILAITFVERDKSQEKVKIIFASNITAKKGDNAIQSGELVQEGLKINFTAQIPEGKALDSWFINDKKREGDSGDRNKLSYTVNLSHAKDKDESKEIEVKFTTKEARQAILQYEEDKILYLEGEGHRPIGQNSEVKTGTNIIFSIKFELINQGRSVDYFTINGKRNNKIKKSERGCIYTVDEKDGEEKGGKLIIKLGAVMKASMSAKLKFDEKEIEVSLSGNTPNDAVIKKDGDEVYEDAIVMCRLKDSNKKAEQWLCNNMPMQGYENRMEFSLSKDLMKKEGDAYILHITVKYKPVKEKIKIKFEDSINCHYYLEEGKSPLGKKINSGQELLEGDTIIFSTKRPADKEFKHWLVGNSSKAGEKNKLEGSVSLKYTVDKADRKNGEIEVKCIFIKKIGTKLVLKDNSIQAEKRVKHGASKILKDGDILEKGDSLSFRINSDKVLNKWLINGRDAKDYLTGNPIINYSYYNKTMEFTFGEEYIDNEDGKNVMEVNCILKEKEKIKIEFDATKLYCFNASDNSTLLNPGDKAQEYDTLTFYVKDGVFIKTWKANDINLDRYKMKPICIVGVDKFYAIQQGNDLVISVSIEEREALPVIIDFNPKRVNCETQNFQDQVQPGTKIMEGTKLFFTAKVATPGEVIEWYINTENNINTHLDPDEPFELTVTDAELNPETSDYVITVFLKRPLL